MLINLTVQIAAEFYKTDRFYKESLRDLKKMNLYENLF